MREDRIIIQGLPSPRLRVRKLDPKALAHKVASKAKKRGEWIFEAYHGGEVSYAYWHRAMTEAAIVVANPLGETVVWMAKLSASRVTLGGAAGAVFPAARALWDKRASEQAQSKARAFLKERHREYFAQTIYERLVSFADSI